MIAALYHFKKNREKEMEKLACQPPTSSAES